MAQIRCEGGWKVVTHDKEHVTLKGKHCESKQGDRKINFSVYEITRGPLLLLQLNLAIHV